MIFTEKVIYLKEITSILQDEDQVEEIKNGIKNGNVYIIQDNFDVSLLSRIREYLSNIGKNSIPNFQTTKVNCDNFHRVKKPDADAVVKGVFHQFCFFPWNKDIFDLFKTFKCVYQLRNRIADLPPDYFTSRVPDQGCTAQLSFHYYPKKVGYLDKHADPIAAHQLAVPILNLSHFGKDFHTGGCFVEKSDASRVYIDQISDFGDLVFFNAQSPHGVETIDPNGPEDWLSFIGRWMLLFIVSHVDLSTSPKSQSLA